METATAAVTMTKADAEMAAAKRFLQQTVLDNPFIPQVPEPKQALFLCCPSREALYGGAAGGGKALALDTPIPVPSGWDTMGNLKVGDSVFDEHGEVCMVVFKSEVMLGHKCYRVTFSDGQEIVADADHLWPTQTEQERMRALRLTDGWRAQRRKTRPLRSTGKKPWLAIANAARKHVFVEPPPFAVRTTSEIASTCLIRGVRLNHSVAVTEPLKLHPVALPIDPYVLGLWLGDGTSSGGGFTSADSELVQAISAAGFDCHKIASKSDQYAYGTHGLFGLLRVNGLLENKHVPRLYLRASLEQRLALLQGLMDTDGCVAHGGSCEFTTTSIALRDGMAELLRTFGIKACPSDEPAMLNGKEVSRKYRFKFRSELPMFRLARKRDKQRRDGFNGIHKRRYIVSAVEVESVPVACIAVSSKSNLYLAGEGMIPTHNTSALLMAALQFVSVPGYAALLLRRTFPDLMKPGSLIPRAMSWLANTDAQWRAQTFTWKFPSGATLSFGYLDTDNDVYQYQSSELQFIGLDELTQFTEWQYRYLFSRLRKLSGVELPLRMRAGTNPGGSGHAWVRDRFVRCLDGKKRDFIPAKLADNPHLDGDTYRQSLGELDHVTRMQLLDGNWDVQAGGLMFKRHWFQVVEAAPADCLWCRYWDVASTKQRSASHDPDWTAGALVGLSSNGQWFIKDMRHMRESPLAVERAVKQTAVMDGRDTMVRMEQEGGASGPALIDHYAREVMVGFDFSGDKPEANKIVRAKPVSAAAEAGNVFAVRGQWLPDFLDEAELFPSLVHDDQVDAVSGAFKCLSEGQVMFA